MKIVKIFLSFFIISLIFPSKTFAKVVINEFLPTPNEGSDWIELFNQDDQDVYLDGWILDDEGTSSNLVEIKEATISAKGFITFDVGSRLNKDEDKIYLRDSSGQIIDEYAYTVDPGSGISIGRVPDGGSWGACNVLTKNSANQCALPTPIPTLTPTPTATPVPTETPTPEPTATPSPTNTPTPTLTPVPTVPRATPTQKLEPVVTALEGDVLGEETSLFTLDEEGAVPEKKDESKDIKDLYQPPEKKKSLLFPVLTISGGLGFVSFAVWSFLKQEKTTSDVI